jgi:hypothetical protein
MGRGPERKMMVKVLRVAWKDGMAYRCEPVEVDEKGLGFSGKGVSQFSRRKIDLILG